MKKISLILLTILFLSLSGCISEPESETVNTLGNENISIAGLYPTSYSVEEYNQFIENWNTSPESFLVWNKLPDNFVYLSDIPEFGFFDLFVPSNNFPSFYKFNFVDKDGDQLVIEITHTSKNNDISTAEYAFAKVTNDMSTMEKKPASQTPSVIVRNSCEYYYNKSGLLSNIVWYNNGVQFQLHGHFDRFDVPLGCFDVYRLLSIDETEANAAFAEIKQALNSK